jgi:ABC-type transport system substrate-binding protein
LTRTPALQVWWLQLNVHRSPFDRPRVRLAIAQAVDREALVRNVLKGVGIPAASLIPKGMRGFRPGLVGQRFDPASARAELEASGATTTELESIHLLVRDLQPDRRIAEFVASQVKANLGVTLILDVLPSPAVTKKLASGDFQAAGPAGWIADVADAQDLLDLFMTEVFRGQATRYSNPAYDKLVAAGDREVNAARRQQDYAQAQQLLVEDAPVAFLYQPEALTLRQSSVMGLTTTPLDDWPGDLFANEIWLASHGP